MESNLISDSEPKISKSTERILLFFGERLAFFLFALFVLVFLISKVNIPKAFSEQEDLKFSRQNANWYQEKIIFPEKRTEKSVSYTVSAVVVTPTPTPTPARLQVNTQDDDIWEKLAECESHKNWSANTGNGYYGGLQFTEGAWRSVGGTGLPHEVTKDEQVMRGKMLQSQRGWGPWNACSKHLGLL